MRESDFEFMKIAYNEAKKSATLNEVPVGAVVIKNNIVVSTAHNLRETKNNALAHAELIAIDLACKAIASWRLLNCSIYVTMEPCLMCMGAILNARLSRLIFGCFDTKNGCCGSVLNFSDFSFTHKKIEVVSGIMQQESATLLSDFFKNKRK